MVPVGPTLPVKLTQPKIDLLAALLEELEPADLPALRACLDAQIVCDAEVARDPIRGSAAFTRSSGNLPRRAPLPLTVRQAMALAVESDDLVRLTLDCGTETTHHRCQVVRLCEDGAWHVKPAMPDPHGFYRVRTGPALGTLPLVTSCEPVPAVVPTRQQGKLLIAGVDFTCTPEAEAAAKIRAAMDAAAVSGNRVVLTLEHKGQPFVRPCSDVRACHSEPGLYAVTWDPPGWGVRGLYDVVRVASMDDPGLPLVTAVEPDRADVLATETPYSADQIREAMTGETLYPGDIGVTWGLGISKERMAEVGPLAAVDEAIDLFKRTNSRGPTPASDDWKAKWAAMGSRNTAGDLSENTTEPTEVRADPVWMVATIADLKRRLARGEWPLVRAAATARLHSAPVEGRLVSIDDPGPLCATTMGTVMHVDGRDRSPIDMVARKLEVWTVLADDLPLPPANEAAKRSHDVTRRVVESQLAEIIGILEADGRDGTVDVFTFLRQRLQERRVMVEELREAREPLTFHTAWGRAKERSDYRKEFWNRCHSSRGAEVHSLPEWLAIVYQGIEVASGPVEPTGRDISTALGNTVVLARDVAERLQDGLTCETSKQRAAALLAALDRFEARTDAMYDQPHARNAEAAAQVPTP
jgi:hypothetical protein